MLLDRIDIDSHGPLSALGLGPFSQRINVIHTAAGSGKTALVRFLRDSLTGTTPAYAGMSGSRGRIVWAAADGLYHCRREPDGSQQGRRYVEFESRLATPTNDRWDRPRVVVDLPAAIVDGIVTDTTLHSLRRVVAALLDAGLDPAAVDRVADADSSIGDRDRNAEVESLRAEIAQLTSAVSHHGTSAESVDRQRLRDRLAALNWELGAIDSRREFARHSDAAIEKRRSDRQTLATAVEEVDRLRRRETELKRRIADLEQARNRLESEARRDESLAAIVRVARTRILWFNRQIEAIQQVVEDLRRLGHHSPATAWDGARWDEANSGDDDAEPLNHLCRLVDRLIGRLEAEQSQWFDQDHPADELIGDAIAESGSDERADLSWLEDSVRRGRIDSLHRAARRRRLDEIADSSVTSDGAKDLLLSTLRSVGSALHSISRRLSGLQQQAYHATHDAVERSESELTDVLQQLVENRTRLVHRVARAQRLPEPLLNEVICGDTPISELLDRDPDPAVPSHPTLTVDGGANESVVSSLPEATCSLTDPLLSDDSTQRDSIRQRREQACQRVEAERRELVTELQQTIRLMNDRLSRAEAIRGRLRNLPAVAAAPVDDRHRIEAEIRQINRSLSVDPISAANAARLHRCRGRLQQLESVADPGAVSTPLAQRSSDYLRRLTGGRLQHLAWSRSADSAINRGRLNVSIDSRSEDDFSAADRFLATLAVRLAAADELSRRGRPLPLVIETPASLFTPAAVWHAERSELRTDTIDDTVDHRWEQDLVNVLAEAASRGRQVILLTDQRPLAVAVVRAGGRGFGFDPTLRFAQPPIDDVTGTFAAGAFAAAGVATLDGGHTTQGLNGFDATVDREPPTVPRSEFDRAASDPRSNPLRAQRRSDQRDVVAFPIGGRFNGNGRGGAKSNPFFLTGDSSIAQSPSVDAVAAARLQVLGVMTVSQLLAASPQELAERVQMIDINAATIRRWQHECRLVCGVAGLRGFDARVLVGCGIIHPREIVEIEPAELAEKVEAFLATDRGDRILRTGTRQEVARLTEWVAEARRGSTTDRRSDRGGAAVARSRPDSTKDSTMPRSTDAESPDGYGRKGPSRTRSRRGRRGGSAATSRPDHHGAAQSDSVPLADSRATAESRPDDATWRFYLDRESPVVDAPAIGPRMADRLAAIGIDTVDDLLTASPKRIAAELELRRVDDAVVRGWQQQATLVCRVPMLRGHDAQLLVAAGITEPERLAECDPQWLLTQIKPISSGRQGQSILRGSAEPDLAEVSDWIAYAQAHRELRAA